MYETYDSWTEGNRVQTCVVQLPISKENPDEAIYNTWVGVVGAKIFKTEDDAAPITLKEKKAHFTLGKPDYNAYIPDPEDMEIFNSLDFDLEEDSEVEQKPLEKMTAEFELVNDDGSKSKVFQDVFAYYELVPEVDKPNLVNFLFYADIPRAKLSEGIIIYQWAALTPKDNTSPVPPIGIVCKVQVGNADGTEVMGYSTGALAAA